MVRNEIDDFKNKLLALHLSYEDCPTNAEVVQLYDLTISFLYPHFNKVRSSSLLEIDKRLENIRRKANELFSNYPNLCPMSGKELTDAYIRYLPDLFARLNMDVEAIYNEDPAAENKEEITRAYPGFYAISAYRIAHWLHDYKIKLIPRIITEYAHSRTGIDIHPAANIGSYFCIDHGTGVVIGETTVIGNHVKIYQGVTLGALSIDKEDANMKRHPTIEDHVVIYANATILGGGTTIGANSTIGGNVWLTESVEPDSKVYYVSNVKCVVKS